MGKEENVLDKINNASAKVEGLYDFLFRKNNDNLTYKIDHIISFNAWFDELLPLITDCNLSDKEVLNLYIVKNINRGLESKLINNFEEFKKYMLELKEDVTNYSKLPDVLVSIKAENKELFHKIIKEDYSLGDRDNYLYNEGVYNELVKDPVFCDIAKQINIIKSFENGEIKLADIDDSILQNDYNMNRICQAITEKLYTAFKDKLEKSNTPEQENKIKEMLDKKIESLVADFQARREKSLQQDNNKVKEDIKKYEI